MDEVQALDGKRPEVQELPPAVLEQAVLEQAVLAHADKFSLSQALHLAIPGGAVRLARGRVFVAAHAGGDPRGRIDRRTDCQCVMVDRRHLESWSLVRQRCQAVSSVSSFCLQTLSVQRCRVGVLAMYHCIVFFSSNIDFVSDESI